MNDEAARHGRPDEQQHLLPTTVAGRRDGLRPFVFLLLARGDDELLEVTFYAATERQAVIDVTRWATKRGWSIEGSDS
jgi:hypothetical protein